MISMERIRKMFKYDRPAAHFGFNIESASPGESVCSFVIEQKHWNSANRVQGGVIFTLADFAFSVAANAYEQYTVSLVSNISFLASPKGSVLTAHAREVSSTKKICTYEILVSDDTGLKVAHCTITGYIQGPFQKETLNLDKLKKDAEKTAE